MSRRLSSNRSLISAATANRTTLSVLLDDRSKMFLKVATIALLISLGLYEPGFASWEETKSACDPRICTDICGTTGRQDFTSFSCNPFTCKCYCNNPPPPNCLPDRDGRCDIYCKETYCGQYFGLLCGSYQNPICTCACNPYGPYLRNNTLGTREQKNNVTAASCLNKGKC